jgi:hypothetical protein
MSDWGERYRVLPSAVEAMLSNCTVEANQGGSHIQQSGAITTKESASKDGR